LSLTDAKNSNETMIKQYAHIHATTLNKNDDGTDATITDADITVISGIDELRALDEAPDPEDPMTVTIQARDSAGDKTTKDIEVYVYDEVNENHTYSLNAHSFAIKLSDIPAHAQEFKEKMIAAAEAKGFDVSVLPPNVQEPLELTVEPAGITATGTHRVTFKIVGVEPEVARTVDAYVYDDIATGNDGSIQGLNATNFKIELSEFKDLDAAEYEALFVMRANAKAYDITTLPPTEAEGNVTISSARPTIFGVHKVTFVSPNGAAQVTVDVEVTDTRDFDFSADATAQVNHTQQRVTLKQSLT